MLDPGHPELATVAEAAQNYAARGWKPVPLNRQTKKPIGRQWQKRPFDPRQFNGNSQNVGIQFGEPSRGLCDVDLDCMDAIGLAPQFLPATGAIFGRRSRPCSHQLYVTDLFTTDKHATIQFKEYHDGRPAGVIVELRIGGDNKGAQTAAPPSIHASGEMVAWVCDGAPARVDGAALKFAVLQLAVAVLLKRHYPTEGVRHDSMLVIGGVLTRAGWTKDSIECLVRAVAQAAGDDEIEDRVTTATGAVDHRSNGHDVAGLPRLRETWGEDVVTTIAKWLTWRNVPDQMPDGAPQFADEALALQFAERHADNLRHVASWTRWLSFDDRRWLVDDTLLAFDRARKLCREIAATCTNRGVASALASAKTVSAVERLAKSDRRLAATVSQWDADIWLLNTPTGVVDLRTGHIRAHRADDYMTKITAVGPAVACAIPLWSAVIERATGKDKTLADYLQRLFGYALTGSTREHSIHFAYGTGANSKGTIFNTVANIMGDYHAAAPIETFTASSFDRHPTELADLRGARMVTATETEEGRHWAESRIKMLTGGDPVKARFMRQDFFQFMPQFTLIVQGNNKPGLRAVDEAIRRRFHLIPFNVTIPEKERDQELTDKLKAEWPGILAWCLAGCRAWQREGLNPPQCVTDATAAYLEAQDSLAAWLEECCDLLPAYWDRTQDLFASWAAWAERAGEPRGDMTSFRGRLEKKPGVAHRRQPGTGRTGYQGVRLKADAGAQN